MPIRYDNPRELGADRLVNAVAAYERSAAPCVVVDFGTAITFDVVSAEGEYLGGDHRARRRDLAGGADLARGAKLPRIDLAPPRVADRQATVDAIRSGIVYGFAGQVDAIVRRLRAELGEETETIATGGLAGHIVPFTEAIDEVDDLLTLTGCGCCTSATLTGAAARRGRRGLPSAPMPRARSPTPSSIGAVRVPNRVRARAARRDRQLVRAPAGQALRRRASRSREMVSSFAIHHRNEKTMHRAAAHPPDERDGRGPVSIQLFGQDPEVMRSAAATVAERGRRPDRPQHGLPGAEGLQDRRRRGAAQGPRHARSRSRAPRARAAACR